MNRREFLKSALTAAALMPITRLAAGDADGGNSGTSKNETRQITRRRYKNTDLTLPLLGFGIDAAALYDQREAEFDDVYDDDGHIMRGQKVKQQAINIPINLRYDFGIGSLAALYFAAGPQFGFNVGDKHKSLFDDSMDWKMKTSNFSVNLGAGVLLLSHLQVGFNYNIVCGKTGELTYKSGFDNALRGRANTWQISAAYYF